METVNYSHTIWKGSNSQISFPVLPPYSTATTEDMVANFYTTSSGTSIEFTQSGGELIISGTVGTVVFQPVQLEALEDGLLKYILEYTIEGSATTVQLETRWYLKTPNPYTAISFTSKEYVDNALSGKQATLVSGTNIKTINNQSLLGAGNIEISGGSGSDYYAGTNIDITNHIISVTGLTIPTKTSQLTNDSGFLTEHQSLAGYATESWVEGKGYLTSHQDISMKADTTAVTQSLANKQDAFTCGNNLDIINHVLIFEPRATGTEMESLFNTVGNHTLEIAELSGDVATKQDTLVSGTNIKTINNQSLLGSGNIEISGSDYYAGSNIDITNHVISVTGITVPTKTSELTNDSGFLTQHQSLSGYATESWVEAKGYLTSHQDISMKADTTAVTAAISTATADMATKTWVGQQGYLTSHQDISMKADTTAVTQSLANKQDTLVSGTNIKTINSQSILGSGNIEISTGTSYSAGAGIIISADTISTQLKTINGTAVQGTGNIAIGTGLSALTGGDSIEIGSDNTINLVYPNGGTASNRISSDIDAMGTIAYAARSLANTVSANTVCLSSTTETGCLKLWVDYLNTFMSSHYSDYNPPSVTWR